MAKIRVLEQHIAELIAAGEVVERPASVVKELLENAIDAGAAQISVAIEGGGIRLIEIIDSGAGIETEFVETAFIRHATSKVQTEDDLNAITTLGFRGEALASIASVARVELLTKTAEDEFACSYRIEGGQPLGLDVAARAVGTTIRVRDLFYNTPARMKFLKKDASEGTFVADLVGHVALSHPEISFKFVREGKVQYVTPGDGDLQSAAYAVLGRDFARDLCKVADEQPPYAISGYITPPKSCRASRSMQYFYINGRYVKNRTMMAALEAAYKGTLMHGKFPGCVLSMQMPHDMIDVNVHPAKTEVRFAREKDVFDAVYRAVKSALANGEGDTRLLNLRSNASVPQGTPTITAAQYVALQGGTSVQNVTHASIKSAASGSTAQNVPQGTMPAAAPTPVVITADAPIPPRVQLHSAGADKPATGLEALYEAEVCDVVGYKAVSPVVPLATEKTEQMPNETFAPRFTPTQKNERLLGDILEPEPWVPVERFGVEPQELDHAQGAVQSEAAMDMSSAEQSFDASASDFSTDEVCQTSLYPQDASAPLRYLGEAFQTYILTQQNDTICIIDKHAAHERLLYEKLAASYGDVASQMLLEAVAVNLSAAEKQAVLEHIELLEQAGLEVEDFGGTTVLVRAVPADVVVSDVTNLVVELAAKLASGARDIMSEKTEWVLHSIACRAAIKAGDASGAQELLHLAAQILSGEIPPYCPHGRPCIITLTRKELEKQFGRIV